MNRSNAKALREVLPVSHCGVHYMAALSDPWHAVHGACIPDGLFPLPSQKVTVTTKGTFSLGTSGIGFIIIDPSVANDAPSGYTSTSASVGTATTPFSSFTNLANILQPALPYATASLAAPNLAARIVSVGVRARYSGVVMNRNGTAVCYEEPDHQSLNAFTFSSMLAQQQSEETDVTNWSPQFPGDNWMAQVCQSGPTRPQDVEFVNTAFPLTVFPPGSTHGPFFGIAISGVAGDLWSYEIATHIEYIGSIVPERTPSHSDPTVFGKVLEAAKGITAVAPLNPSRLGSLIQSVSQGISETLPLLQDGAKLVKAAVSMDIGSVLTAGAAILSNKNVRSVLDGSTVQNSLTQRERTSTRRNHAHLSGSRGGMGALSLLFGDEPMF